MKGYVQNATMDLFNEQLVTLRTEIKNQDKAFVEKVVQNRKENEKRIELIQDTM